jgi:hypothetical protein
MTSSAAKQRVAIAKDVIKQIKLGKIVLGGGYWSSWEPKKVADTLPLKKTTCRVCAMGAVFAAKVLRNGSDLVNASVNDQAIIEDLKGVFTAKQLRLIETAYEGGFCGDGDSDRPSEKQEKRARGFYTAHSPVYNENFDTEDDAEAMEQSRMVAIMKNVIRNEGTFKP